MMKIKERIVSSKGHTVGYKVGGRKFSRKEACELAAKNRIENVRIIRHPSCDYLMGTNGLVLSSLPERKSA